MGSRPSLLATLVECTPKPATAGFASAALLATTGETYAARH